MGFAILEAHTLHCGLVECNLITYPQQTMSLFSLWQQFFPPAPSFTEKDVVPGSQVGKVFIITGANAGITSAPQNALLSVLSADCMILRHRLFTGEALVSHRCYNLSCWTFTG